MSVCLTRGVRRAGGLTAAGDEGVGAGATDASKLHSRLPSVRTRTLVVCGLVRANVLEIIQASAPSAALQHRKCQRCNMPRCWPEGLQPWTGQEERSTCSAV